MRRLEVCLTSLLVVLGACDAEKDADAPPTEQSADADGIAKSDEGMSKVVEAPPADPSPTTAADPTTPVVQSDLAAPAGGEVDRARFPDPAWYSPALLEGASVKKQGHSAPRADGTFSSSLLLEAGPELSAEDCVSSIREKITDPVSWKETQSGADGRVTVRGDAERYYVTLVCGQVEGKTVASINYTWTK